MRIGEADVYKRQEVPFLPYMDRPADTKAGCKHRCTDAALGVITGDVDILEITTEW